MSNTSNSSQRHLTQVRGILGWCMKPTHSEFRYELHTTAADAKAIRSLCSGFADIQVLCKKPESTKAQSVALIVRPIHPWII